MAEVKCVATRDSYGNALKELKAEGAENLVVLDADLSAATRTGIFRKESPERHINCGIAESNRIRIAAEIVRIVPNLWDEWLLCFTVPASCSILLATL